MRFLLTRRWLLFAAAVVVLAYGCLLLGRWQFSRLADREERNGYTRANLSAPPVDAADVLTLDRPVPLAGEWTRVTVRGRYDPGGGLVVRYQTRDGHPGVDVVAPLMLGDGTAVLVDRGWLGTGNVGGSVPDPPAPPPGEVTVEGWVRADAHDDGATEVSDRSVRAVSSRSVAALVSYPVRQGFVDAGRETPQGEPKLLPAELPDLGNGPHFFYGLQWWFFGALALGGFAYLAYDERRTARRSEQPSRT